MATVTGLTADRMLEIEAESIVGGAVNPVNGHLVLTRHDGGTIDAGLVVSSANLVDTIDDQSIDGLKTFVKLTTFNGGTSTKTQSIGVGADGTQQLLTINAPAAQSVQLVNLKKNAVTQYQIDQNGQVAAIGSDHYFGTNALGGTGERLHVKADGANVSLKAEASHADASLIMQPKGLGGVYVQKADGTNWGWFGSDGTFVLQQQSLHIRASASTNKRAQVFFESFSGSPEWSLLNDSAVNGTHDFGLWDNINSRMSLKVDAANNFILTGSLEAKATNNYLGNNADGSAGMALRVIAGPTDPSIYLQAQGTPTDVNVILKPQGAGFVYIQDSSGNSHFMQGPAGNISANGTDHYFGPNAISNGAGSRIRLNAPSATNAAIYVESSGADASLTVQAKGAGVLYLNPRGNQNNGLGITSDSNGKIYLFNNVGGAGGAFPGIVLQTRPGGAIQQWDGTSTWFQSDGGGNLIALGDNHYFGAFAGGSGTSVSRLHIFTVPTGSVLQSEGDTANRDLALRIKGTGTFFVQDAAGNGLFTIDSAGIVRTGVTGGGTTAGGLQVGGGINGYHGELYFSRNLGDGTVHAISSGGSGNSGMVFDMRNTAAGFWKWRTGVGSLTDRMILDGNGKLSVYLNGGGTGTASDGCLINASPNPGFSALKVLTNWTTGNGGNLLTLNNATGQLFAIDTNGTPIFGSSAVAVVTYTSATAGGATALPGAPVGYLAIYVNGTLRRLPYWA